MRTLCFLLVSFTAVSQEICNNGVDDNGDGLVDLQETSCQCDVALTPSSLIPNPSFEDTVSCPNSAGQITYSKFWFDGSSGTSDYMNSCNFVFPGVQACPLGNFPDGDAVVGFYCMQGYKEYVGACLTSPMIAGTSYTITMSAGAAGMVSVNMCGFQSPLDSISLAIYGTSACSNMPFGGLNCVPVTSFTELARAKLKVDRDYHTITMTFTPTQNYAGIVVGSTCDLPTDYNPSDVCQPYVVLDNLILNETAAFQPVQITYSGTLCTNNLVLTASTDTTGGAFQWYRDSIALVGQTAPMLTISSSGSYQAVYTFPGGCISGSFTVPDGNPVISVNSGTICKGDSILLTAQGADIYSWSPSTGLSSSAGSIVEAKPTVTTTYTVTGTSPACTSDTTATVTVVNIDVQVNDQSICEGQLAVFSATGASSYSWSPATGLSAVTGPTVTSLSVTDINYTVTGTGPNGCQDTAIASLIVLPVPSASILTADPLQGTPGLTVTFSNGSTGATGFLWDFGNNQNNTTSDVNSAYTITYLQPGTYTISLIAEKNVCRDTAYRTVVILVPEMLIVNIPNVVTPDNDGVNDFFNLNILYAKAIDVTIVNRWGQTVRRFDGMKESWNGKTNSGNEVVNGVYFFTYKIEGINGKFIDGGGFVEVIR